MYERMLNKEIKPSIEDLSLNIGSSAELFHRYNSFLSDHYKTTQEIRFPYGNEYGWCVTHRKSKKLICDVFAETEAFTVMIRLSNQQFDEVYDTLQSETKQMIDNKYPCGNGGWIHYRVFTKEHLEDIKILVRAKCGELPCGHDENDDPTKTKEENAVHIESLIGMLEEKATSEAYKALQELEKISNETGLTYRYIDKFINMIHSDKYAIRVRGFRLFCKQAKWDTDFIIDENIDDALNILKDEKPTAVRQAFDALPDIIRYKPDLRDVVKTAVSGINYLRYKETMHSLLAKDTEEVLSLIRQLDD